MKKLKIAVVTGTRAEYGLLFCLLREILADKSLQLQLIVTGMHLSSEFGSTYHFIEEDGFKIDAKVEILLSSDTAIGIAKSMGLGIIGFADTFTRLSPDIIVLLGDRFETFAVAQVALVHRIPIAHIHGGELSEGALDDAIRHAITKMSHLHFVAAETYRKRVIQMGENPAHVFNVGAPGLEKIKKTKLLTRQKLEKKLGFQLGELNFLVTYHPATLDIKENAEALQGLFTALDAFPQAKIIFTKANADEAGRFVNSKIEAYVAKNQKRAISFASLGNLNYLSLIQFVDVVIGNSSSGLIEVPYFCKPTINIGSRQAKRLKGPSIIDCDIGVDELIQGIQKALSPSFQKTLQHSRSPYQQDNTAKKITSIIKKTNLKNLIVKHFHDMETIG